MNESDRYLEKVADVFISMGEKFGFLGAVSPAMYLFKIESISNDLAIFTVRLFPFILVVVSVVFLRKGLSIVKDLDAKGYYDKK